MPRNNSDDWKEGFLARRKKAWAETSNPHHRDHYEQLARSRLDGPRYAPACPGVAELSEPV